MAGNVYYCVLYHASENCILFLKTNVIAYIPTALLNIQGQTRNVSEILGKDGY